MKAVHTIKDGYHQPLISVSGGGNWIESLSDENPVAFLPKLGSACFGSKFSLKSSPVLPDGLTLQ